MWLCHRIPVYLPLPISDSSLRSKYMHLICIFSLYYPPKCSVIFALLCKPSPIPVSLNAQQQLWLNRDWIQNRSSFILQGKQEKHKPICTAVTFCPEWKLSESQPGNSPQQNSCSCCWACKGSASPAPLRLSADYALSHAADCYVQVVEPLCS